MRFVCLLIAALVGGAMSETAAQSGRPVNDDFAQAITVPTVNGSITLHGSLAHATRQAGEPYNSNGVASVWFQWTPAVSGFFRVAAPETVSTWIFERSNSVTNLVLLGQDGEMPWLDAGTTYSLAVYARSQFTGPDFELKIETVPDRPANDNLANATEVLEQDGKVGIRGSGWGATFEPGEPAHTNGLASVWYQWKPSASGRVKFLSERPLPDLAFFFERTDLGLAGNPFSRLVNRAHEGESPLLAVGVTYYIAVYAAREEAGEIDFQMELAPAPVEPRPPNDDFAAALELHESDGYLLVSGSTLGATFEKNEPYYGNAFGTVWFKWTPSGRPIGFTPLLGNDGPRIFSGTSLENLQLLQDWQKIIPGQTYYLSVNGSAPAGTPFGFALQVESSLRTSPQAYTDDFGRAFQLREASGTLYLWLEGATVEAGEPPTGMNCPGQERSVWHKFSAPVDGTFRVRTEGGLPGGGALTVFAGQSLNTLVPVNSEQIAGGQQFRMSAGLTYFIRAVGCVPYGALLDYVFEPAANAGGSTTAQRFTQSITMTPVRDVVFGTPPISLQATASSGLPVKFAIVSGPSTVTGPVVNVTGGGFVTVAATQPGNDLYEAAAEVRQTFRVRAAPQSLTFEAVDTSVWPVQLHAVSTAGLPVSFALLSGTATISQGFIVASSDGPLTVQVTQPGDDNYEPAQPVTQTFVAKRLSQVIRFPPLGEIQLNGSSAHPAIPAESPATAGATSLALTPRNILLDASASSGLPVSYQIRLGPARVNGNVLTVNGPGEVVIEAGQSGDAIFAPTSVQQKVQVVIATAAPILSILRSGPSAALTWPEAYAGFGLESATSPIGPWSGLETSSEPTLGRFLHVIEPVEPRRFYRLKRAP